MSTLRANTITNTAGGDSMPVADINQGRLKSWVNLNGTGTIAIRDSFGISSITDGGTGNYYAEMSTALANANYAIYCCCRISGTIAVATPNYDSNTVSSLRSFSSTVAATPASIDVAYMIIAASGDQ